MKNWSATLVLALAFASAQEAVAADFSLTTYRCGADQLLSGPLGRGRYVWAKNGVGAVGGYADSRAKKYFNTTFQGETDYWHGKGIYVYPAYADPDNEYITWIGPGPNVPTNDARYATTEDGIYTKSPWIKPANVYHDTICEPGCYTFDQEVEFKTGNIPIRKAHETARRDLMTLSDDATFDALSFEQNEVMNYTVDRWDALQEVLEFSMESGGSLRVTLEHPLVTEEGTIKQAKNFKVGENLVQRDGTLDPIRSITSTMYFGKAYNLKPVSTSLTRNILVAQGYLNGSARFQSEWVDELNRILLRRNVTQDVLPIK